LNGGKDDRLFDVTAFETRTNDPREGMRHEPLEGVIVLPNHLLGSANDAILNWGLQSSPAMIRPAMIHDLPELVGAATA
jgi:hypothetical protein